MLKLPRPAREAIPWLLWVWTAESSQMPASLGCQ